MNLINERHQIEKYTHISAQLMTPLMPSQEARLHTFCRPWQSSKPPTLAHLHSHLLQANLNLLLQNTVWNVSPRVSEIVNYVVIRQSKPRVNLIFGAP